MPVSIWRDGSSVEVVVQHSSPNVCVIWRTEPRRSRRVLLGPKALVVLRTARAYHTRDTRSIVQAYTRTYHQEPLAKRASTSLLARAVPWEECRRLELKKYPPNKVLIDEFLLS